VAEQRRTREREELKRASLEFSRTENERVRRLAKGPDSFPIDQVIRQIEADGDVWLYSNEFTQRLGLDVNHQGRFELESNLRVSVSHLQKLKKRGACEVVLWGETLGKTLEEINSLEEQRYEAAERTRLRQEETKRAETEKREAEKRRQFRKETLASEREELVSSRALDSKQDLLPEWTRLGERLAAPPNEHSAHQSYI
jgi:hypothetical protein